MSNQPQAQPGMTLIQVTVPNPYPPNGQLLVQLPSGTQAYVALPPNSPPGTVINAQVPDIQAAAVAPPVSMAMATAVAMGDVEIGGVGYGDYGGGKEQGGGYGMPSAPVMKGVGYN